MRKKVYNIFAARRQCVGAAFAMATQPSVRLSRFCRTCWDALPTSHPAVVSGRQLPATSLSVHHA